MCGANKFMAITRVISDARDPAWAKDLLGANLNGSNDFGVTGAGSSFVSCFAEVTISGETRPALTSL